MTNYLLKIAVTDHEGYYSEKYSSFYSAEELRLVHKFVEFLESNENKWDPDKYGEMFGTDDDEYDDTIADDIESITSFLPYDRVNNIVLNWVKSVVIYEIAGQNVIL